MPTIRSWGTHCKPMVFVEDLNLAVKLKQAFGDGVWLDLRDDWNPVEMIKEDLEEEQDKNRELEDRVEELESDLSSAQCDADDAEERAAERYADEISEVRDLLEEAVTKLNNI